MILARLSVLFSLNSMRYSYSSLDLFINMKYCLGARIPERLSLRTSFWNLKILGPKAFPQQRHVGYSRPNAIRIYRLFEYCQKESPLE